MATSFANGEATQEEMEAAVAAARYAAIAASTDARYAAIAASTDARYAANAAYYAAADAAARYAAVAAADAAARYVDTRKIQSDRLRDLCAEIDARI